MAINILKLPHEILHLILCSLSTTTDILSVQRSCKTLRQIAQESNLLQYKLELATAGLEDVGNWSSSTSISDRVEALRTRQRAWAQLEWRSTIRIQGPAELFRAHSFHVVDNYLVVLEGNGLIHLTALPSIYQMDATSHALHWETIQAPPSAEAQLPLMRAENNLMAMVIILPFTSSEETWRKRLELHLFSMSNHTYHPAAKSSVIPLYEHSNWSSIDFATMEIAGEYIAVLLPPDNRLDDFSPRPGTFLLVDWKTGTKHPYVLPFSWTSNVEGFVFLRQDIILFPNLEENSLLIFKIISSPIGIDLALVRRLLLPEASVHKEVVYISCACSPNAFGQPSTNSTGPFRDIPDETIIRFTIKIGHTPSHLPNLYGGDIFVFVTHRRALLALLSPSILAIPFGDPRLQSGDVITSDWHEWGPKRTRWFDAVHLEDARGAPFGQRVMLSFQGLCDFNTYTTRKLHAQNSDTDHHLLNGRRQRVVRRKTVIPARFIFLNDVESELPYCEIKCEEQGSDAMWMDDERVVFSEPWDNEIVVHMLG